MLVAHVGGSSLSINWSRIREWKSVLDSAGYISLYRNGQDFIRVELDGAKRWVAFRREVGGIEYEVIGFQETVGAIEHNGLIIGGSNRCFLAWLHPGGQVTVGSSPFLGAGR